MPFLFILSGITIEKAALVFPPFIATAVRRLCQTKIHHYIFLSFAFEFFAQKKEPEKERENQVCFLAPLVWLSARRKCWKCDTVHFFLVRYHIDRLSSCYLAVFHLQFIKINSYRYFGYDRREGNKQHVGYEDHTIENEIRKKITFLFFRYSRFGVRVIRNCMKLCVCVCAKKKQAWAQNAVWLLRMREW